MNSDNVRKAGRPNKTFQMNLNNIPQTLAEVDSICQNKKTRAIVKDFDLTDRLPAKTKSKKKVTKQCKKKAKRDYMNDSYF